MGLDENALEQMTQMLQQFTYADLSDAERRPAPVVADDLKPLLCRLELNIGYFGQFAALSEGPHRTEGTSEP